MVFDFMIIYDLIPKRFYPYRSHVTGEVFKMNFSEAYEDEINYLRRILVEHFNENGIRCYEDNKIVFECETKGKRIFYGFYDLKFSIGMSCYSESERHRR
jgi:hypothetical protein